MRTPARGFTVQVDALYNYYVAGLRTINVVVTFYNDYLEVCSAFHAFHREIEMQSPSTRGDPLRQDAPGRKTEFRTTSCPVEGRGTIPFSDWCCARLVATMRRPPLGRPASAAYGAAGRSQPRTPAHAGV